MKPNQIFSNTCHSIIVNVDLSPKNTRIAHTTQTITSLIYQNTSSLELCTIYFNPSTAPTTNLDHIK